MANHYDNACEQDEISVFLQQILLRSSSSSSSSSCCFQSSAAHYDHHALAPQNQERPAMMISQSHDAGLGYEADDCYCDYESEEGMAEALLPKKKQPGGSSKRSRAAEVHNLSEKRRRSRINEKMKALQNLIPNSNKSDKASMLDEAIEYLKQLQLQVQMLTMRNGLSLYPMMLHNYNQASLMGMDTIKDRNNSNDDLVNNIDRQDISEDAQALGLLQGNRSKQRALFPSLSNIIGSKPTFETEPFQLSAEAKDKALKIQSLHQDFSRADHKGGIFIETNYELGDKTSSLVAFESMQLNTNPVFSQELNMSQIGWAPTHDHEKVKGKEIVKDWDLFMY